ncbi:MAG: LPS export ABC transporter permease LptF [Bradyrhizobium sp.]
MDSIDRYVFRTTFGAFLMVLFNLTAVIWVTQILRQIDLITNQGQTVLVFLTITSLIIPTLMLILAPISMVIAVAYALVKLNNDSELVVMSAAGISPVRLFRPFLVVALVVSLLVAFVGAYLSPLLQREMNDRLSKIRADVVANIVRPGAFTTVERGLTFHIREKRNNSQFAGIVIDDNRDPTERTTILAEYGQIVETERGTFLVMTDGTVQRRRKAERDPTFVRFERYAFDLSPYTVGSRVSFGLRERYFWDLAYPDPNDPLLKSAPAQFRVEFHDRILAPLYPLAFAIIAFVILCSPRTTRQGRLMSTMLVVAGVVTLRIVGFACMNIGLHTPFALSIVYAFVALSVGLGLYAIVSGKIPDVADGIDLTRIRDRVLAKILPRAVRH